MLMLPERLAERGRSRGGARGRPGGRRTRGGGPRANTLGRGLAAAGDRERGIATLGAAPAIAVEPASTRSAAPT